MNLYTFTTEAYEGSGGFRNGNYIYKFARELEYETRKKMATYINFVKSVADSLYVPVFATPATRVCNDDLYNAFLENCDNSGNNIQSVLKNAGKWTTLHGLCFIVMDTFKDAPDITAVAIEERKFPYIYIKTADEVVDYEIDQWGRLVNVTFYDGMESIEGEKYQTYRLWDEEKSYRFYKKDDKIISMGVDFHNLGVMPVIACQKTIDYNNLLTDPPFYDIASLSRAIYNGTSELNNIQRQQAFSLLILPTHNQNPDVELGANSILCIDPNATQSPSFISPDAAIMAGIRDNVESLIKALLDSADALGATAVNKGASTQSGIAMSYTFLGQQSVLNEMASLTEKTEYRIAELFKLYTGTEFEYEVKYSTNYREDPAQILNKFTILERMANLDISDAIKTQIKDNMVDVIDALFKIGDEKVESLKKLVAQENEMIGDFTQEETPTEEEV